tara:strand:+ start:954 stop:1289 length:336 start_codon:yes stop_codon:yes gene_type:complete
MALQTIKQLQQEEDYSYISYSLENNYIDLPDGDYKIKCKSYNYAAKKNTAQSKFQNFYSETVVHVRSNLIETKSLLKAAGEIRQQTKYWGVFLEVAQPSENNSFIEIIFGS